MNRFKLLVVAAVLVQGCSMHFDPFLHSAENTDAEPEPVSPPANGLWYQQAPSEVQPPSAAPDQRLQQSPLMVFRSPGNSYQASYIHKSLDDYAEQMAMQLVGNMQGLAQTRRMAVASFVELDANLKQTSVLGNQLAEKLMAQMQGFGLPVVDFKAMEQIQIGAQGDLLFSRDVSELARQQDIDLVLSGTLVRNARGVQIHARILSMQDRQLVASANGFIPAVVVDSLYSPPYVLSE